MGMILPEDTGFDTGYVYGPGGTPLVVEGEAICQTVLDVNVEAGMTNLREYFKDVPLVFWGLPADFPGVTPGQGIAVAGEAAEAYAQAFPISPIPAAVTDPGVEIGFGDEFEASGRGAVNWAIALGAMAILVFVMFK